MDDRGCTSRSENSINKEVDVLLGPQDFEVFMLQIIKVSSITVQDSATSMFDTFLVFINYL